MSRFTLKMLVIILFINLVSIHFCKAQENLEVLLDRVREAVGYDELKNWKDGFRFEAMGKAGGYKCQFDFQFLADGRFQMTFDSQLKEVYCFDGNQGWYTDYTGLTYPMEYYKLEVKKLIAWFISSHWLDPECHLDMTLNSINQKRSTAQISLKVSNGVVGAMIHINTDDYFPEKLTWKIYSDENFVELKKHKIIGSFYFPYHIYIMEDGTEIDIRFKDIGEMARASLRRCKSYDGEAPDTRIRHNASSFIWSNFTNRGLLVRPTINGCDDALFILDTGSSCYDIDIDYAKKLDMKKFGKGKAVGVGGTFSITFLQGESLILGSVEQTNPIFVKSYWPYNKKSNRDQVAGILGFDLFYRAVVEVNIHENTVNVYEPGTYNNKNIKWHEIVFCGDIPALKCRLSNGIEGIYEIDTGFSGNVSFHRDFVIKNNLLEGRELSEVILQGAGGEIPAFQGYIEWFEMAGYKIENLRVVFAGTDKGATSNRFTAGTIGGELLSHFKILVFDYAGKRIGFAH